MTWDTQDYTALCNINDSLMRIADALESITQLQIRPIPRCGANIFGMQCRLSQGHSEACIPDPGSKL